MPRTPMSRVIEAIQAVISQDPGKRGIAPLIALAGASLPRAAHALVQAQAVAICTGFPCNIGLSPPTENDGLSGAIAVAAAALRLGCPKVRLVTDQVNAAPLLACLQDTGYAPEFGGLELQAAEAGVSIARYSAASHRGQLELWSVPGEEACSEADIAQLHELRRSSDFVFAIERAGRAADGTSRTMRAFEMPDIAPLHLLFQQDEHASVTPAFRAAVGDGGNELGLGSLQAAVAEHVNLGDVIADTTPSDAVIMAGVSNWGGWALCAAAQVVHSLARPHGTPGLDLLPTREQELATLRTQAGAGALDGILKLAGTTVDGLDFEVHAGVLDQLRELAQQRA